MTTTGNNVNSCEGVDKLHNHDYGRGKWRSILDYYMVCIGHAFEAKNFFLFFALHVQAGASTLPIIILSLFTVAIPIYFLQSALGQFSSTGYLSVLRISPIFKGMGYLMLILNIISASCKSIIAAHLLVYFFASMSADLPWMTCNNTWNSANCVKIEDFPEKCNCSDFNTSFSNGEFLENYVQGSYGYMTFPWLLLTATFLVWLIIVFFQMDGIKSISRIIRYTAIVPFIIAVVFFIRFAFFPDAFRFIWERMDFEIHRFLDFKTWIEIPILITLMTQGTGWGVTLTMASYTEYKEDTMKYSIAVPFITAALTYFAICIPFMIIAAIPHQGYPNMIDFTCFEFPFYQFPKVLSNIEAPHFWSIMFYGMIMLCEINSLAVQMFTILTSLLDEYVKLRSCKSVLRVGSCALMFIFSIFFMKFISVGELFIITLGALTYYTQAVVVFLELMMILWFYGRKRFQRDMKAMLGKIFSTWQFFFIRFVTPLCILFAGLIHWETTLLFHNSIIYAFLIICSIPWIWVIAYGIFTIITTPGTCREKFQKSTTPSNWYPANPTDREEFNLKTGRTNRSEP